MNELFTNDVQNLIKMFHIIAMKKWIKSVNKGLGSIGYTFEQELGKAPDSLFFPDYYGTEIKCTGRYSRYPITLFTVAFDGPTFPEINRIVDKYGYPDKTFKDKKILFADVSCIEKVFVSSGYYFKLDVDEVGEKVYLCIYSSNEELIERKSFVYFKTLYDHLVLKLERLALVYASKKNFGEDIFFRYYRINIYKLKDFDTFISLLKLGVIKVKLISRISKSGNDIGRYRNKNLVFMLKKDSINQLFEEIYSYNYDSTFF